MIEAVYMRHHGTYRQTFSTEKEALAQLEEWSAYGDIAPLYGVFVDGEVRYAKNEKEEAVQRWYPYAENLGTPEARRCA
jgi:hypothetical protein